LLRTVGEDQQQNNWRHPVSSGET